MTEPATNLFARVLFFTNTASGSVNQASAEQVRKHLQRWCPQFEEVEVKPGLNLLDRTKQAVAEKASLVVVAGGDGTLREIASGLVQTQTPLAIVPLGTYNNFALSLDIPKNIDSACEIIERGHIREIDVGVAGADRYFFEAAGVGVDAQLFPIGEQVKRGRWHDLWRALSVVLEHRQTPVQLVFDQAVDAAYRQSFRGQSPVRHRRRRFRRKRDRIRIRCSFVAVGNGPYYGGNFMICPGAIVDDGLLSVGVYRDFSKRELITHLWSISRGRRQFNPKLEMFQTTTLEVSSPQMLPVHVDGNPAGDTPVRFQVLAKALRVVAPPPGIRPNLPAAPPRSKDAARV